jgi:glycosyltransferase involved in cell wall biosynthesis
VVIVAEQLRRTVPGGIGTYVRGLVKGLGVMGDAGPAIALWASRAPRNGADPLAALALTVTSPLPGTALVAAWDRGWAGFGGRAGSGATATSGGDVDVVHAPSLAVPPRRGAPVAVTVHDLAWRQVPEAFPARGRRWHEAALARALDRASLFVVPSRTTADALVESGASAARVEVVDEGSDHLPAPDPVGAGAVLAGLGVMGPFLLSVGTLEPRKNLSRLVAAYRIARRRLPEPWPLVVVGPQGWGRGPAHDDGDTTDHHATDGDDGVVLAGWVDDAVLASLYRQARVVAYVPLLEGFGLPALEAMAAGTPVVASPMPSLGGAALEVDPCDVGAIADALVVAATDDAVRSVLVAAGDRRAASLTWEAAARAHVDLWGSLRA